jgi:transposase InsO family protein
MTEHGFEVIFRRNEAIVTNPDTGENVIVARRDKDMYYIDELSEESRVSQISMSLQEKHERFGHLNEKDLKNIIRKQKVDGIDIKADEALPVCETCVKGKQTRKPFTRSVSQSTELLELVHTDVRGPMRVNSLAGSRYFVTFIDDKSRWCEVYFMKKKSEVIEKFKEYKCLVEKKTERKIKIVRSDNGTEYTSHYLEDFLKQEGIRHELTVEYTPQQNGVAERKNRSLVETARCLMIQSGLSASFWAEAILTANHIRNRCPSRSLGGEIPFKMWTRRTPIASYFRKFGTTAFALDKTPGKGKFDSRSKKCIFIGYSVQSKAYRLWDPEARKVIRSRDVTFTGRNQAENDFTDFIDEEIFKKNPENIEFNVPETQKEDKQTETCDLEAENGEEIPVIMKRGLGRPKKVLTGKRGRPRKLFNMVEVNEEEVEAEEEENHENEELHDVAGLIEFGDPQTVSEALSSPEAAWKKAVNAEYEALKRNQTWIIVDRPQGKKTVESRWVPRTKFKKDGSVDRRKARLVAKGFTQKAGIDFNETFAPVARLGSIRLFMAIAVELGLQVHQLDFTSAYLNGEIEEEVFMEVPSDFYDILNEKESRKFRGNKVCLMRKALYGLKQSGRQWYKKLDEKLKQQKLKPLNSDPCVYINKEDGNIVIVVIYVDDLMVASDNPRKLQRLKSELSKSFEMKDLGPLSFCLGIEFTQNVEKQTITMPQSKYIKETLSRFNMENCKGVTTPINPNEKLSKEMCPKTEEEKKAVEKLPYQSLVGSLMYLAVSTRPDIAHAVSMLSQFNTNFGEQHWRAAKRVLRYLKNTENLGLMFKKSGQELVGYADAD